MTEVGDCHLALNNGMPVFLCLPFFQETEQKWKEQTLVTFSQVLEIDPIIVTGQHLLP